MSDLDEIKPWRRKKHKKEEKITKKEQKQAKKHKRKQKKQATSISESSCKHELCTARVLPTRKACSQAS